MKQKTVTTNNEMNSFMRIVYAICILLVFFVGFSVWSSGKDAEISELEQNGNRLLTHEELLEYQEGTEMYYPPEWKILQQLEKRRQENQIARQAILIPQWNREQITQDIETISENLETEAENMESKPLPPLLKIQQARRLGPRTFTPTNKELLNSTVKPRMGNRVMPNEVLKRNVAKPDMETQLDEVLGITPSEEDVEGSQAGIAENSPKRVPEDVENVGNSAKTLPTIEENVPYDHKEGMKILHFFNQKARERLKTYSQEIRDYACILYKWDDTNTIADGRDVMQIKLREEPYSIYSKSIYPERHTGREWLYWDGHYENYVVIFSGKGAFNRTLALKPDDSGIKNCATRSILQLGFRRLLEELVEISENEANFRNTVIRYYPQANVGERACYALEVTFPEFTEVADFYRIQIYVDQELDLPIQLVIYDWPEEEGKPAEVRESYTYVITHLNPGFSDEDFCHLNPEYQFASYLPPPLGAEVNYMKEKFPHLAKMKKK